MKEFVYYPGFNVANPAFLNFALLYLDKLNPIIPPRGDDEWVQLDAELDTDTRLFVPHRPMYPEGARATREAILWVEEVLRHPSLFAGTLGTADAPERWRTRECQTWEVYEEKYTDDWVSFCEQNGLGEKSANGVRVERQLGELYLSFLAQTVADARRVSPITDSSELDRMALSVRAARDERDRTLTVAQRVFELKVPTDLAEIPVEKLLAFRSRPGFMQRLRAFHSSIDAFIGGAEGADGDAFLDEYISVWGAFSDEIVSLGVGTTVVGVGIWSLVNNPPAQPLPYVSSVLGGGALAVAAVKGLRRLPNWYFARRYVADLERLQR